MTTTQRQLKRKLGRLLKLLPPEFRRKMTYRRNFALQRHEEEFLLALIAERGQAGCVYSSPRLAATQWCWQEPGRWDREYLVLAFKRLGRDRKLRTLAQQSDQRAAA